MHTGRSKIENDEVELLFVRKQRSVDERRAQDAN